MKREAKVIGGVLLGALAGLAAGMLFAPDSGEKTRKKIKASTKKMVDDTKYAAKNTADEVAKAVANGIDDIANTSKQSLAKVKEKMSA